VSVARSAPDALCGAGSRAPDRRARGGTVMVGDGIDVELPPGPHHPLEPV